MDVVPSPAPALAAPPPAVTFRPCKQCHKSQIPEYSGYQRCVVCREVNRIKSKQNAERKKQRERDRVALAMKSLNALSSPPLNPSKIVEVVGFSKTGATKHRILESESPKDLSQLDGEKQKVALATMKKNLKKQTGVGTTWPTPNRDSSSKEYQSASLLYDALKSKVLSVSFQGSSTKKLLQFNGCHAIVSVASIDSIRRLHIVANDLRKIARLSFNTTPLSSHSSGSSHSMVLQCTCLGSTTSAPQPNISAPPKMKGTSGDLIRWARTSTGSSQAASVPRVCQGTITVTVLDDNSHPFVSGQQIVVRIQHPSKTAVL